MERSVRTELLGEKREIGPKNEKPPEKTFWKRMKETLAKGIIVLGITVAAAVPCALVSSCSLIVPEADEKNAAGDTDVDTDTDSDTDTDTDTDSDTDTDTDTDSDTDTDTDTDSDTDTDTGPDLGFPIIGSQINIAEEEAFGNIPISDAPADWIYDAGGYSLKLFTIYNTIAYDPGVFGVQDPTLTYLFGTGPLDPGTGFADSLGSPPVTKHVHLYRTWVLSASAEAALTAAPITLEEGVFVDLGNGISGTVEIYWNNVGAPDAADPQYICSIKIGGVAGVWGFSGVTGSASMTAEGVPVCPENEGNGLTGVTFSACTWPEIIPAGRVFIKFGGDSFAITEVTPPGGLF